jgi:hypothetical protein
LAVASRYGEVFGLDRVAFVPERPPGTSPDIHIATSPTEWFLECKRLDRMADVTVALRDEARQVCEHTVTALRLQRLPAVVEVVFGGRPVEVDASELAQAAIASFREGGPATKVRGATVSARPLEMRPLETYWLFPSPGYFSERYGFTSSSGHGLLPAMIMRPKGPSFIDEVEWECAVVWKIDNEDLLWREKRLAFSTLFKGLKQLEAAGTHTVLHVWFERHGRHGHRREQLKKLVDTLNASEKHLFAWIVANETASDVSVGGRFDFQEHPSAIGGPTSDSERPPVEHVFVGKEDLCGVGEWGIGAVLPSLDGDT